MKKFFLLISLIIICGVISTILVLNFKSILFQKQQIPFQKAVLLRDEKLLVFDPSNKELKEIAKLTDFIKPISSIDWKNWGRSQGLFDYLDIDYQIVNDRFFFYSDKEDALTSISLKNGQFTIYPHQGFNLLISPNGKEAVWFRNVTPKSEASLFLKDKTEFYKQDIELWHGDLDNKKAELIYKTTIPEIWVDASPLVSAFLWQNNDVYFVLGSIWSPGATGSYFKINLLTKEVEKIPFDYFYYFDEQRRIITEAEEVKGEWSGASPMKNQLVLEGFDKEPIKIRMRNTAGGIKFSIIVTVSPDKKKILFYDEDVNSDYYSLVLYDVSQNISKIIVDDIKNDWSKDWWIRNIKFIPNEIIAVNLEKVEWNRRKTLFIDTSGQELFEISDAWFLGSTSF